MVRPLDYFQWFRLETRTTTGDWVEEMKSGWFCVIKMGTCPLGKCRTKKTAHMRQATYAPWQEATQSVFSLVGCEQWIGACTLHVHLSYACKKMLTTTTIALFKLHLCCYCGLYTIYVMIFSFCDEAYLRCCLPRTMDIRGGWAFSRISIHITGRTWPSISQKINTRRNRAKGSNLWTRSLLLYSYQRSIWQLLPPRPWKRCFGNPGARWTHRMY